MITITRYHDISTGHRVYGHESKCAHVHGHNYRIHFTCSAQELDDVGRVIDFSVVKEKLCMWVENHWDHKMLLWYKDPLSESISNLDPSGVVVTTFNPTAENMAKYLVVVVGPKQLVNTGVTLTSVEIEETAKCSAKYTI
jgi:6-pyruvoyltetrahydropterin/6-carboxytetrahydropterin synthase